MLKAIRALPPYIISNRGSMNTIFEHALTVFMAFFAIMNPIANTAVFAGLTSQIGKEKQRKVAFKALFITFVIILLFCILGKSIFHLFGITLPALRIEIGRAHV